MLRRIVGREGFTLLEILVVLVLLGLLIGAIVPNLLSQSTKGEVNRVLRDITNVETAVKTFRVDVSRWPASLPDLMSDTVLIDIDGDTVPPGLTNRWDGPYIEATELTVSSELETAAGGTIDGFTTSDGTTDWTLNDQTYIALSVDGLPTDHIDALDIEIDGAVNADSGRLHVVSTTAHYLIAPID